MSHSYVSLDQELEVSWESVGMYGGGVRREGKRKGKSKKVILKNGLAVLVKKGFLSFIVSSPGSGVPP